MDDLVIPWSEESNMSLPEKAYKEAGFVKTVGSVFLFGGGNGQPPFPTNQDLTDSFEQLNSLPSKSLLTVGAKALSKHYERNGPLKVPGLRGNQAKNYTSVEHPFWSKPIGCEKHKNLIARGHLDRLLNQTSLWKNIHNINPATVVYEIRDPIHMYGMRWTVISSNDKDLKSINGKTESKKYKLEFRGYLEPNR